MRWIHKANRHTEEWVMAIAVDLDGTLAEYHGWKGIHHIGEPIPLMMDMVLGWINEGIEVVIFTARAGSEEESKPVREWLEKNGIGNLEVTNIKRKEFKTMYDDRAYRVTRNKGIIE